MICKSEINRMNMKQKRLSLSNFQSMSQNVLASIKGGDNDVDYIIIYIEGVPYKVRINKNGQPVSAPERIE